MTQDVFSVSTRSSFGAARLRERIAKAVVRKRLARLDLGHLTLVDGEGVETFGNRGTDLCATVRVRNPRMYEAIVLRGALGAAETFMDGFWDSDDLTQVIRLLARNRSVLAEINGGSARFARPSLAFFRWLRRNTKTGSRRNIAAHYDLGNEFFEQFLDPTLTYSSGIFAHADASMEEASIAKYDRVCHKLRLTSQDRVLEIGSGWGGFAIHAASRIGCRVTTTTVSREQYALVTDRVREAGLAGLIEVQLRDYRDLDGQFDKLVSIEMVEAVGSDHLGTFFETCSERLAEDGVMALQAITVPDQDYVSHVRSTDFIQRYIFPGGELVSLGAIATAVATKTNLRITHVEDLTPHYAETLRRWRARMLENLEKIRALNLEERFLRMWEYYFCYCEGGFEERETGLLQVVFEKPATRRDALLGSLT